MTKLAKVNKLEGKIQAIFKNLLTVNGKNIAVPADVPINGEVGDTIRIEYNERGFLTKSELVKKGEPEAERKKESATENATKIDEPIKNILEKPSYHEISRLLVDPVYKDNIILLQTCYKERNQTVRELHLIPDSVLDEDEIDRLHSIAVRGAIKDALVLKKAAGEL